MSFFFKYFLFTFCFTLCVFNALAQNESNKWYFGANAALDFTTNPPTPLAGSAMNTFEGCASVSDNAGNLLFYTDGMTVYNRLHAVMSNGTGLLAYFSSSQAALVVKQPGSSIIYYVFTQGAMSDGLRYSVIDMSLDGGKGAVTVKNTLLSIPSSEKLVAVKHCNGVDTWVLTHDDLGNKYRSYLVSSAGVNVNAVISPVGANYVSGNDIGCMKASPSGRTLVSALFGPSPGYEICDFDNATGGVSNPYFLPGFFSAYGVAFSRDGTKLYGTRISSPEIYQWDMCAGSGAAIAASKYNVCINGKDKGQLQLAHDGKIYVARPYEQSLGVISNPDAAGAACNFVEAGQSIAPGFSRSGLPNFLQAFPTPSIAPFTFTVNGCQQVGFTAPPQVQTFLSGTCRSGYGLNSIQWIFGDPASGTANTSSAASPVHSFPNLATYTVKLALNYACGVTDTLMQQVRVDKLCLIINSSAITCASLGSATVSTTNGIGPYSYTWVPTNQTGSVATGLSPGNYSITVFDAGANVSSTSTVALTASLSYTGTVVHTNISCNGLTNGSATVTSVTGGSGNQTYTWTNGSTSSSNALINNLSLGTWSITVTDALTGCNFTSTFSISEPPATTLNISSNPSVTCIGDYLVLTGNNSGGTPMAGGNYAYVWSAAPASSGTYIPAQNSYTVSEGVAGTYSYTLTSTDANGCGTATAIAVSFINKPVLSVSNVSTCPGQVGTLTVTGAASYTWNNNSTDSLFTAAPASNQQYTVTGSIQGCKATATASIILKPAASATLTSNSPVCEGESLQLSANEGANYSWSGPQGFTSDVRSPVINNVSPANSGIYQFLTSINGCTTGISNTLIVYPAPVANFDYLPENPLENTDPVSFRSAAITSDIKFFSWAIKDNDSTYTAASRDTSHFYSEAGSYPVALSVVNNRGCKATVVKLVNVVPDFGIYVPNVFTPNGDGVNDSFYPVSRGTRLYDFKVYDRWGNIMFSTGDASAGWDGYYRGAVCKQDLYVWRVKVSGANGKLKELTGYVTLLLK